MGTLTTSEIANEIPNACNSKFFSGLALHCFIKKKQS